MTLTRNASCLAALATTCALLTACSGSKDDSAARRDHVERMIEVQLPGSVRRNTGEAVVVNDVRCVAEDDNHYECLATVTGPDGEGGTEQADIPLTATCDGSQCIWRTAE